jgi:hypothetical protein
MSINSNEMKKNTNFFIAKLLIMSILSANSLFLILPGALFADKVEVYTVAAQPTPKSNLSFPCYLSKINSVTKKINIERQLIFKDKQGLMFVHSYSNLRRIILGAHATGNFHLNIIDMDNPSIEKIVSILQKNSFFYKSKLLHYPSSRLVNGITIVTGNDDKLIGVDLSSGDIELLPWEDYKNIELGGRVGIWMYGGNYLYLWDNKDGTFDFFAGDSKIRFPEPKMPGSVSFVENDVIVALIRNKNYLVITAASGDILEPSGLGAARYHVLNKQNNTWNTITIRGEKTWLRSFNGWLAGTVLTAFKGKESL